MKVKLFDVVNEKMADIGDVPLGEIGDVIKTLNHWGGVYCDGDYVEELTGMFVLDGDEAYFRVDVES